MKILRQVDSDTFKLIDKEVLSADELARMMREEPDEFASGVAYYPVTFGRGRTKEIAETIKAKEVTL